MAFTPGLTCLQPESLARRYWAAPPGPYWGWGLVGRGLGTVLAVTRGSDTDPSLT
jgi:hypothetical protein